MDIKLFEDIGLTKSETEVYTQLLKTGSVKIGLLMKNVDFHRSRIYEAMNRLIDKGLVSYVIKNNIKYFEATDPKRLLTYIEEQKEKLDEKQEKINKILPELKQQQIMPSAEAHVFVGKEGFKTMRKDVLKQKQTLYLIGAVAKEDKYLQYFFPNFNRERIRNKIQWNILYDHEAKGKPITKLSLMKSKFLSKEYSSPTVINIYADRVVNVVWNEDVPLCIMTINKDIANSYRKWFALMWKHAEK